MLVGNKSSFAIEFNISLASAQESILAIGSFLVWVAGNQYGIDRPDASAMGCSVDEVVQRIRDHGKHVAPFSCIADGRRIGKEVVTAIYIDDMRSNYLGVEASEFFRILNYSHVQWVPDGGESFDDGSIILQFDNNDQVRLIAFKRSYNEEVILENTFRDISIEMGVFYKTAERFVEIFNIERLSMLRRDA